MIFGTLGPNELSIIERCPYYRGVRKEGLDCVSFHLLPSLSIIMLRHVIFTL